MLVGLDFDWLLLFAFYLGQIFAFGSEKLLIEAHLGLNILCPKAELFLEIEISRQKLDLRTDYLKLLCSQTFEYRIAQRQKFLVN